MRKRRWHGLVEFRTCCSITWAINYSDRHCHRGLTVPKDNRPRQLRSRWTINRLWVRASLTSNKPPKLRGDAWYKICDSYKLQWYTRADLCVYNITVISTPHQQSIPALIERERPCCSQGTSTGEHADDAPPTSHCCRLLSTQLWPRSPPISFLDDSICKWQSRTTPRPMIVHALQLRLLDPSVWVERYKSGLI